MSTTDVMRVQFDTAGGTVSRVEFLKHADLTRPDQNMVLLDDSKDRYYQAQSGLLATVPGVSYPTHKTLMTVRPGARSLDNSAQELSVVFESPEVQGVKLVKTYTLKRGAYDMAVTHAVVNTSNQAVSPQLYVQLVRDGNKPAGESSFYSTFTGPAVYTELKKYQKVEFADIKKKKADFEKQSPSGYIAMVQHYFASAWLLPDGLNRDISMDAVDIGTQLPDCCYRTTMIAQLPEIKAGRNLQNKRHTFRRTTRREQFGVSLPRPRVGQRLRLVDDFGQALVLVVGSTQSVVEELGLVHRGLGGVVESCFLLAQRPRLSQHGQDESHQPTHHGNA